MHGCKVLDACPNHSSMCACMQRLMSLRSLIYIATATSISLNGVDVSTDVLCLECVQNKLLSKNAPEVTENDLPLTCVSRWTTYSRDQKNAILIASLAISYAVNVEPEIRALLTN